MSKDQASSNPSIPTQIPRAPRMKSIPKKLQRGIDASIPGIGVVIREPQASSPHPSSPSKKRGSSSQINVSSASKKKNTGKGSKAQGKMPVVQAKTRMKRASNASPTANEVADSSTDSGFEAESAPVVADALEEIKLHKNAPAGFRTAPVPLPPGHNAQFKDQYSTRGFCAVVSVNLSQVHQECNIDLSPWLGPYQSFISIEAAYFPELVKLFYFNMRADHIMTDDGDLVEERLSTSVRGLEFKITASILNRLLKVANPPPASTPYYSNEEVYRTLMKTTDVPDDQRVTLSLKPSDMPPLHRAIWYVYSQNFVQKGGSYTHLTKWDYRFFTAFIQKHPLNIGQWIFQEMSNFKFASRRGSYMPYASLVSLIMFYYKIWYVGPPDQMKFIPAFGKTQFNLMKISFEPEGSGHSRAPPRSQTRASHSFAQEAQSAPPPPSALGLEDRIRDMVEAALVSHRLIMRTELDKLRAEFKLGLCEVVARQDQLRQQLGQMSEASEQKQEEMSDQLIDLDAKLSSTWTTACVARDNIDRLIDHFQLGSSFPSGLGSTSAPASDPQPSEPIPDPTSVESPPTSPSSPPFTFPSPPRPSSPVASPITPATEILPSPLTPSTIPFPDPIPSTPTTEPFSTPSPYVSDPPIDPMTAMVLWTPPLVFLDPVYVDDDKGGEGDE